MSGHVPGGVSVVVPSLNEYANLEQVLPLICADYEVIVVEGSRFRRTQELVSRVRPGTVVVEQTRYGKGNALACGFEVATGEIIVTLDADGSASPEEIPHFVAAIREGADFAKGSRARGGSEDITALRWTGNGALTLLVNLLFGTRYTDLCYGFNAFRSSLLPVLDLPASAPVDGPMQWGDGFEIETIMNCRVARRDVVVTEVPSREHLRVHGVSNLNAWRDGWRVLIAIVRERMDRSRRASVTVQGRSLAR